MVISVLSALRTGMLARKRLLAVGGGIVAVTTVAAASNHLLSPTKESGTTSSGDNFFQRILFPTSLCDGNIGKILSLAVVRNNLVVLKKYVSEGGNADETHPGGWTALHTAAANGRVECAKYLLQHGADINAMDSYHPERDSRFLRHRQSDFCDRLNPFMEFVGMTPLHYAAVVNSVEMVQLLISNNADPTIEDECGSKPVDYAQTHTVKDMLEEYASKYETVAKERREKENIKMEDAARKRRRDFPLEKRLHQYIVGQEGPILAISAAIRRRENGWHNEDSPMVFLFLGSSGVGKTELAKRLAQYVHDDGKSENVESNPKNNKRTRSAMHPKGFIRLDMSEYQEKHEVARLIGSPPGYVGHSDGGQLTKMLKETPNAVVLLDEVEKAHADVLTIMLQLFDEGRLTDGQGNTVECKDAIFIMTSNLAASEIAEHAWELRQRAEETQQGDGPFMLSKDFINGIIRPILKHHFKRDEFLGRINQILYFVPFSRSELGELVDLEMEKWQDRAMERHKIELTWTQDVVDFVIKEYDIHFGARSLQHAVDRLVVNQLAAAHEQEKLLQGGKVEVSVKGGEVILDISSPQNLQGEDHDSDEGGSSLSKWLFGNSKNEADQSNDNHDSKK
eukprot:m.50421 g.50421  ORF g.50421 m.50421 type:complete len:623 (+) comp7512_c0_seq2:137-2005(+)